jgi:hypothetical protein
MWYKELSELHDLSEYEVYLAGGFAEYLNNPTIAKTWDADICLVSNEPDLPKLKEILDDGYRLGFKNRIFVDFKYVNWYHWDVFRKISVGETVDIDSSKMIVIKNYLKFQKYVDGVLEHETITPKNDCLITLMDGLYQISGTPTLLVDKVINKFNEGIYKGVYVDLKKDNQFIN